MSRQLTRLIMILSLLALIVVCYFAYCRKTPQAKAAPAVPAGKVVVAPAVDTETSAIPGIAALPLPPRDGLLGQFDQIRWQMVDNAKAMVAIGGQRLQREEQLRTQDAETQRLYNAGASEREAYLTKILADAQIQEFDRRSAKLHDRQRTWADMCQKLQKGTAKP